MDKHDLNASPVNEYIGQLQLTDPEPRTIVYASMANGAVITTLTCTHRATPNKSINRILWESFPGVDMYGEWDYSLHSGGIVATRISRAFGTHVVETLSIPISDYGEFDLLSSEIEYRQANKEEEQEEQEEREEKTE